jgi:hypothetical protein
MELGPWVSLRRTLMRAQEQTNTDHIECVQLLLSFVYLEVPCNAVSCEPCRSLGVPCSHVGNSSCIHVCYVQGSIA